MITNWDIISRLDPQTGSLRYTLVVDGTEHDARLIAKKLQGYVQPPEPAVAPYVYAFELPADLDEDTLQRIRTATEEGIAQTNKINQFVPGGILGEPLFNGEVTKEDKDFPTFITTDPSESFFNAPTLPEAETTSPLPPAPSITEELESKQIRLDSTQNDLSVEQQTVSTDDAAENSGSLTINDKDMLIKDMEGTLLDKMPLEDIFSAETKYDMFLDLENQQLVKNSQVKREQKINNLADGKDSLEDTFNVFEQQIKDQTCIIDLDDLNTVTDRLSQKDFGFVQHADTQTLPPQEEPSVQKNGTLPPSVQEERGTAQESTQTVDKTETPVSATQVPLPPVRQELQHPEQENLSEEEGKTSVTRPPFPPVIAPEEHTSSPEGDTQGLPPINLKQSPDSPTGTLDEKSAAVDVTAFKISLPENATATAKKILDPLPESENLSGMPEEVVLQNTLSPQPPVSPKPEQIDSSEDLPEFTLREKPVESLEKTFNLETTLNTDIMRTQYEKSFHNPSDPPAMHHRSPAQPQVPNKEEVNAQEDTIGDNVMEENMEEKTTFRIRRKIDPAAPAAPAAPIPAVPAAPQAPKAPVPPPVAMPSRPSAQTIFEKTKTIDHSIEIPLSELKKHNWPLEVPLVPTYTLENMVMSVNRFAHATAVSVIDNPGKLYNPLVLHGATGTGKTHFLNAMAYAFSKKYGQENIFMTNGVRLSRGIQRYVMEGNIEKFEKFMDTVKVLLIDDIHLLAINEQNRTYISNLLNKFLRDHKQIVITSKYPPESLAKLEELIRFRLDSGWISELKPAGGSAHFKIVKKMLLENGVDLNDTQITAFFGAPHMTLGTVTRSIRRLKVLENLIFPNMSEFDRSQANVFEKLLATTGEDESSEILQKDISDIPAISTVGNGEWGRIGFFYPQSSSHMMNWMVYALQQRAKELGIPGGFDIAVRSSYATENIISSAFKIANLCDNKKLKGAVILGPALNVCEPSVRENFYDILTHMLEIMLIRCGIINYENAKAPSTYVKIISELMR